MGLKSLEDVSLADLKVVYDALLIDFSNTKTFNNMTHPDMVRKRMILEAIAAEIEDRVRVVRDKVIGECGL